LINYLEKIYLYDAPISYDLCVKICSTISAKKFEEYVCFLKKGESRKAIQIMYEITEYGYSVIDILDYFFSFVKSTPSLNETEKYRIIPFLCKYITIFNKIHEDTLELALFTNNLSEMIF
jgi:hypothetical protein